MKTELFIDGKKIESDDRSLKAALVKRNFEPSNLSGLYGSYSYTIHLPLTSYNIQIFDYCNFANVQTDYPHVEHVAKLVIDGITVFEDGRARVIGASKTNIQIALYFDNYVYLSNIANITLKEYFDKVNVTYKDLPFPGVIRWDYDFEKYENDFMVWVSHLDGITTYASSINQSQNNNFHPERIRPAIKLKILLDTLVPEYFMEDRISSFLNNIWLMLPTTKGNREVAENIKIELEGTVNYSYLTKGGRPDILQRLECHSVYNLIFRTGNDQPQYIRLPFKGLYQLNVSIKALYPDGGDWNQNFSYAFGLYSIDRQPEYEGYWLWSDYDIYTSGNQNADLFEREVFLDIGSPCDVCFGLSDISGYKDFEIDIKLSYISNDSRYYSETTFLLDYPVKENLPNIKVCDLVKSVMGLFGLMVIIKNGIPTFYTIDYIVTNKDKAIDITSWRIDKKDDKLEYSYGLTKKNILRYSGDNFGEYIFSADDTQYNENVVLEQPFGLSDLPFSLYNFDNVKKEYVLQKSETAELLLRYPFKETIYTPCQAEEGLVPISMNSFQTMGLKYKELVDIYWEGYMNLFAKRPRLSKMRFALPIYIYATLDFTIPVYCETNYYMITKATYYTESGTCDLDLVLMDK